MKKQIHSRFSLRKGKALLSLMLLLGMAPQESVAQRIQQPLGRGVVAVKNGSSVFVSWRKLAQEPEGAQYNVYVRDAGATEYTKVNASPLSATCLSTTTTQVPVGKEVAVALVVDGVEQGVSEPFSFTGLSLRSAFVDITYSTFLPHDEYNTKFIWPADLTGDGEYDFVVDRLSNTGGTHKIEGYTRHGEHLWTVDMGPNVNISAGHNDMVVAYDMDCDGKSEVVIKSSDGTRFWDKANNTWGSYLKGAANGDTDGDGVIDYTSHATKNPPQYITVVDGLTGTEKNTIEMPFPSDGTNTYSRTNRAEYMGEEYNLLNGHMGICYLDGVHPSVAMEYMVRTTDKNHHYYVSAWGYDFTGGTAGAWKEHFTWSRNDKTPWPAEFHHIRVGDVDLDGRDEILEGGYAVDDNGTMLFSAGISHGDRFRMSDIDPERPGLETFAIQQNAGDMLGQILYDAGTGEAIKKWYLSAVGDVGRGECMDVDANYKGYEMWSTMGGLYDCTGELIPGGASPFPREGVWWDGELDREMLNAPDGNGFNAYVGKFDGTRLIEMAKISGWVVAASYGTRPAFFGDMIGDWRDEVILHKNSGNGCSGIMGFTTDYATSVSLYCLQENPAYRMQCTTRGYYQSPFPDYYLGYDMSLPALPPVMVTDLVWSGGTSWTAGSYLTHDRTATAAYADGKSVLFDLSGDASQAIAINEAVSPSTVYAMVPKGMEYHWNGSGSLCGETELWKSMNGRLVVDIPLKQTGKTIISEGTLEVNNEISGPVELRARGTLAGDATVNDITLEGALNYEGGRIAPGASAAAEENPNGVENYAFGTITFRKGLTLDKRTFLEMDIADDSETPGDLLKVEGDLNVTATTTFTIRHGNPEVNPGKYKLIEYTGAFSGKMENFAVRGLTGLSYNIVNEENAICLIVNEQRAAATGVTWTGAESNVWDYQTKNFQLDGTATEFVAGDGVLFTDEATTTSVTLDELMPVQSVTFTNSTKGYTLGGEGGLSGAGSLTMNGTGKLTLNATKSDYTGATILNSGTVTVAALADGGTASSIGAASTSADNWQMGKATLIVSNSNTATDRGLTLTDTATLQITSGATALKGVIKGKGTLVKTGSGQLNVTYAGTNSYSGGTIVKKGTLAQGAWNSTFGPLGSPLTVENGTVQIFNNNSTSAVPNFNYKVIVPEGGKLTLNAGSRCYINGSFSGSGAVTLTIPYVRTDMLADWSAFTGSLSVSGNFRLSKAMDMKGTALTLGDGTSMGHYSQGGSSALSLTSSIGSLASTYTTAWVGDGTYNVGYNNTKATYAGTLSGTYHKYGTAEWVLTGTENTAASVNVHEGALVVNNTEGVAANVVTVQNGAVLYGKGIVKNVTLKRGATLRAGQYDFSAGTLTLNGTLTSTGGATLSLKISQYRNDKLSVAGNVTLNKDTLELVALNRTFAEGDEFQLIVCEKTISGSVIIKGEPGEGLAWDTTDFLTTGTVRVVATEGIHSVGADRVKVFPQIVTTDCQVDASRACTGTLELRLTDAGGRQLLHRPFDAAEVQRLSMAGYPAGVYFIRLTQGNEHKVVRVVKVNDN